MTEEQKQEEAWQRLGFSDTNISSIGGKGRRNNPQWIADIKKAIATREDALTSLMAQTGLKPSNISSMLNGSTANGASAIAALCADEVIETLVTLSTGHELNNQANAAPSFTPYTPTTISSILHDSSADIAKAVEALYKARPPLQGFMNETGMKLKNVSSMFTGTNIGINAAAKALTVPDDESKTPTDKAKKLLAMTVSKDGKDINLFTTANLSSMLHGAKENTADGINALYKARNSFKTLIESGSWEMKNLSSMLSVAGQHIGTAITDLNRHIPTLQTIIDQTDFTAENLSSMLNGAGRHIGTAITDLDSILPRLQNIIDQTDFTAENLSSMLAGAGQHIGTAIKDGLTQIATLEKKIKNEQTSLTDTQRYTHSNISSAINASGAKIGVGIDRMLKKWGKLIELVKDGGYDASNITQQLNSTPFSKRGALIDELHGNIGKDTTIPPGTGATVETQSPAATPNNGHKR